MKKFIITILFSALIVQSAYAVLVSSIYPSSVKDVRTLVIWLQENFEYQDESGDSWKKPEQTVRDKGGDCEDFAILASKVLNDFEIKNYIVVLTFKHEKDAHAICVFKNPDGTWSLFSNNALFGDKNISLKRLLTITFSDWKKAYFVTANRQYYYMMAR